VPQKVAIAQEARVADATIYDNAPDDNAGGGTTLRAGNTNSGDTRRALLRFDLAQVPAGSVVTSATLQLTITQVPGGGNASPTTQTLHKLLTSWVEGSQTGVGSGGAAEAGAVTWNDRRSGEAIWGTAGGDFESTESAL